MVPKWVVKMYKTLPKYFVPPWRKFEDKEERLREKDYQLKVRKIAGGATAIFTLFPMVASPCRILTFLLLMSQVSQRGIVTESSARMPGGGAPGNFNFRETLLAVTGVFIPGFVMGFAFQGRESV